MLTCWIRAGGPAIALQICPFLEELEKTLPEEIPHEILVCTNEKDPVEEKVKTFSKVHSSVKIIFSDFSSFKKPLTALSLNTKKGSTVLSLSVGVILRKEQLQEGLKNLKGRVKVYGWEVEQQKNDGSYPGKGWYNTAALLDEIVVNLIKEGEIPDWVDNGKLGFREGVIIGGNEEIPIMGKLLQQQDNALFILNRASPVSLCVKIGTQISFKEKLKRKKIVGEIYMQKLYEELPVEKKTTDYTTWHTLFWSSLVVVHL